LAEAGVLKGSLVLPIYYEDTDLSGFVYHANYLKFFERAREHVIGVKFLKELFDQGAHFVVHKASLEYKSPARHGDQLLIETSGAYSRSPMIAFEQNAYVLEKGQKRVAVLGQVSIVVLNAEHRPIRMPDAIIEKFAQHVHETIDLSGFH
jgi:acyl-CoA thioester hydrolase